MMSIYKHVYVHDYAEGIASTDELSGLLFFFGAIMYILPDTFHFKVGI